MTITSQISTAVSTAGLRGMTSADTRAQLDLTPTPGGIREENEDDIRRMVRKSRGAGQN